MEKEGLTEGVGMTIQIQDSTSCCSKTIFQESLCAVFKIKNITSATVLKLKLLLLKKVPLPYGCRLKF